MSFFPGKDPAPGDATAADAIDLVIVPRSVDLGHFEVRRALPHARRRMVGAWPLHDRERRRAGTSRRQRERRAGRGRSRDCRRRRAPRWRSKRTRSSGKGDASRFAACFQATACRERWRRRPARHRRRDRSARAAAESHPAGAALRAPAREGTRARTRRKAPALCPAAAGAVASSASVS